MRSGYLATVHRGIYRIAHQAPSEHEAEFAAVLRCGPGALLSHRSAANTYGFLSYPAAGDVWITNTSGRGATTDGLRVLRTAVLEPWDVWFLGWLPLTSPARTLLDLAGIIDPDSLEEAVAEAQARQLITEGTLRRQLKRSNGRRGAQNLRALLDRTAPPAATRSKAERMMLRLIRNAGLPEPLVNERLGRWRPDFWWPDHELVAEFDSAAFHTDIRSFRRDREKSNELQVMGITVLRFTWHELTRAPELLVERVRTALDRGGRRGAGATLRADG